MANKYEEMIRSEWEKYCGEEHKLLPNIMLLGATGCGKSSLINLVFGKELALVNDVSRGTEDFKTFWGAKYGMGVNLIDSRGYEMEDGSGESFSHYVASIKEQMKESRKRDPAGKIHIIWYCISITGKFQEYDTRILRLLRKEPELRNRVAVVLTKCDQDKEDGSEAKIFRQLVAKEIGRSVNVFEVSTDPRVPLELQRLMEWSASQLDDEDMKEAFVASQMVSLKAKRESATKAIAGYAATAAAIGATPIPMADAALLTPLQITMSTHIIRIYGMESFAHISKAVLGSILIPTLGKAFAGELIKLIPGVGQIVGPVINASVASLITSAIGFAISEICYDSCKRIAKGEYVDMSTIFDTETIRSYVQAYMKTHKG